MKAGISKELVLKSMEILAEKHVGHSVLFGIGGTANDAVLRLEKGYRPDAQVYLTAGAVARGDDHLVQHFLHHAPSMEEMKTWLLDAENAAVIVDSLSQLSDRVDQGFD